MKRLFGSKYLILLLGILTVLAIAYLTAGISALEFKPGQSFAVERPTQEPPPAPSVIGTQPVSVLNMIIWAALFLMVSSILLALLNPEQRKKVLGSLLRLAMLIVLISLVINRFREKIIPPQQEATPAPLSFGDLSTGSGEAPPPFVPPSLPPWAVYLISLGLLLVVAGLVWGSLWYYRKRHASEPLGELAHIVRSTLKEIRSSEDWENAVIQCYVRMSAVVSIRRSLSRQVAMTPTEFAVQLEAAGLPQVAVQRLTMLFERVRYGAKKTTQQDVDEAVASLTAILHACGEAY